MLVFNQRFYGNSGEEIDIAEQDVLFTTFSNGDRQLTFEVNHALKVEREVPAVRISNKIELKRRLSK